jgi:hypothetical protein
VVRLDLLRYRLDAVEVLDVDGQPFLLAQKLDGVRVHFPRQRRQVQIRSYGVLQCALLPDRLQLQLDFL